MIKIKRREQLKNILDDHATIVQTSNGNTYKYLPYWFEFNIDGIIMHDMEKIPEDLKHAIKEFKL